MPAARIDGDCRVTGDLTVDGALPSVNRSDLVQDDAQEYAVPLTDLRVWDALSSLLPASSSADDLAIDTNTFGTDAPSVNTGDVKASTVTRYARFLFGLPPEYQDGETVQIQVSAGMETTVADGSATLYVECYKHDREGDDGDSDLCSTAAQSINSLTAADKTFTITASGLTAGDILDIRLAVAVTDSATGTAVQASIFAVEMLLDVKG